MRDEETNVRTARHPRSAASLHGHAVVQERVRSQGAIRLRQRRQNLPQHLRNAQQKLRVRVFLLITHICLQWMTAHWHAATAIDDVIMFQLFFFKSLIFTGNTCMKCPCHDAWPWLAFTSAAAIASVPTSTIRCAEPTAKPIRTSASCSWRIAAPDR